MDLKPVADSLGALFSSPAFWGAVGVLIGGTTTGFFTIRAESIRADKAAALDSVKRRDARQLDRDLFMRETLVALQDTISEVEDLVRQMAPRLHDEDVSERYTVTCGRMTTLASRIADDTVRGEIGEFLLGAEKMKLAKSSDDRLRELAKAVVHAYVAMQRAGALIRATFEYGGDVRSK